LGILTQAVLFLFLLAAGVAALLVASPSAFFWAKLVGAGFLIWLGLRGWVKARGGVVLRAVRAHTIHGRAFLIATINAKSVAGYLAAFTQFVRPGVPIWGQMGVIGPTALVITAASFCTSSAIGAGLGRAALGAVLNLWFRRGIAVCFVIYGALLSGLAVQGRLHQRAEGRIALSEPPAGIF